VCFYAFSPFDELSATARRCDSIRFTMCKDVSRKRPTQFTRQLSSLRANLDDTLPVTHLSQHADVNECTDAWRRSFFCSSRRNWVSSFYGFFVVGEYTPVTSHPYHSSDWTRLCGLVKFFCHGEETAYAKRQVPQARTSGRLCINTMHTKIER